MIVLWITKESTFSPGSEKNLSQESAQEGSKVNKIWNCSVIKLLYSNESNMVYGWSPDKHYFTANYPF